MNRYSTCYSYERFELLSQWGRHLKNKSCCQSEIKKACSLIQINLRTFTSKRVSKSWKNWFWLFWRRIYKQRLCWGFLLPRNMEQLSYNIHPESTVVHFSYLTMYDPRCSLTSLTELPRAVQMTQRLIIINCFLNTTLCQLLHCLKLNHCHYQHLLNHGINLLDIHDDPCTRNSSRSVVPFSRNHITAAGEKKIECWSL